jgi:rhamnulokinase
MSQYLAIDLGAESGRAIAGTLDNGHLTVEELHRFPNPTVRDTDGLFWDMPHLWNEIQAGIQMAAGRTLSGIGVDTWGVDCAFVGVDGKLVDRPRHYRDPRNAAAMQQVFEIVPRDEVFGYTGVQFMQINTLYQVYAAKIFGEGVLERTWRLLQIPDLFNFWLTGEARSEISIASTSQFFNPETMTWATELLARLSIETEMLGPLIVPGTLLGNTKEHPHVPVYAVAGHDTGSAVAAVPAGAHEHWCYISSGTWSLMGLELHAPVINSHSLAANLTNEVGVSKTIRLLKNIAGLWLLQECRRTWVEEGREYTYEQLAEMAAEARPFSAMIDPDAFLDPGAMPAQIAAHCRSTGQEPPATHGEYARAILESLALRYRYVLETLEAVAGRKIEVIHIVGGGSRNMVLNRFVADCTGRVVIAGPSECTAIGNILVQAMGAGELSNLREIRGVVRQSFPPVTIEPRPSAAWDDAYDRYLRRSGPSS